MSDWSLLPQDVLRLVLSKLLSPRDNVWASAVCKQWRSICKEIIFPWLMLTDRNDGNHTYNFFSVSDSQIYKLKLPELEHRWCIGSSYSWLMTLGFDIVLRLLDPFTRAQILLPPLSKQENSSSGDNGPVEYSQANLVHKVIMSSDPRSSPADCVIMAICGKKNSIAYLRLGDEAWTIIPNCEPTNQFQDIFYHNEQFYAASNEQLFMCHIDTQPYLTAFGPKYLTPLACYLVDSTGDLLLVTRGVHPAFVLPQNFSGKIRFTSRMDAYFRLHKLAAGQTAWMEVKDIGDQVLFLGDNQSLCISSQSSPRCTPNSVYYSSLRYNARAYGKTMDMGIFHLKGRSKTSFDQEIFYDGTNGPPIWLFQGSK